MRGRAVVIAFLASGCGFSIDIGANNGMADGGDGGDGGGSATGDGGLGCYGTGIVIVCPITQPPPSYTVTLPTTIDTNVGGNCTTVNGTNASTPCVIIAETIDIGADVRGIGPRPIVMVATKTFSITGSIDVASHASGTGAGVSTSVCTNGTGPNGLGGGAGGTFIGDGGNGGNGDGGNPGPPTMPTVLRGGCRGQTGGGPFGLGGDGGHGGGGFYAIAGEAISMMGRINASGRGGAGAGFGTIAGGAGGGGGGAGGMIVLDAPQLQIGGELFASGGGGGGGSSGVSNGGGGDDPSSAQMMPEGGVNAGGAGKGGNGTAGTTMNGSAGISATVFGTGGGGGGGGAGYIKIYGIAQLTGVVSPPPAP